jgi:hypothetical protein
MTYDIYDTDTANIVGSFHNKDEALAMVRRAIGEDGSEAVASWALGPTDSSKPVISGTQLVDRALHVTSGA